MASMEPTTEWLNEKLCDLASVFSGAGPAAAFALSPFSENSKISWRDFPSHFALMTATSYAGSDSAPAPPLRALERLLHPEFTRDCLVCC
jgi:hypothetical protein